MKRAIENANILIVEDQPRQMSFLIEQLQERFGDLRIATTVSEATKELTEKQYDLILLDIMLPLGPDKEFSAQESFNAGLVLFEKLRNGDFDKTARDIPVIIFTARVDSFLSRKAFDLGVNKIIHKPASASDVIKAIEEAE